MDVEAKLVLRVILGKMRGRAGEASLAHFGLVSPYSPSLSVLFHSLVAPRTQQDADGLLLRRLAILLLLYPHKEKILRAPKKLPSELFL